jgi:hypothetical protein
VMRASMGSRLEALIHLLIIEVMYHFKLSTPTYGVLVE